MDTSAMAQVDHVLDQSATDEMADELKALRIS